MQDILIKQSLTTLEDIYDFIDKEYLSFKAIKEYHKIISNELTKK